MNLGVQTASYEILKDNNGIIRIKFDFLVVLSLVKD